MFDMITPMKMAKQGDLVFLKMLLHGKGYSISKDMTLYFVKVDEVKQVVIAGTDYALTNTIELPLRSIKKIVSISDNSIIYKSDDRDMVYGIR